MESIADHNHRAAAAMRIALMRLAVIMVAMPPQQQFFQRKKQQDAGQHRAAHRSRTASHLHRFRQNIEKYRAEQRTNGITDQRIDELITKFERLKVDKAPEQKCIIQ